MRLVIAHFQGAKKAGESVKCLCPNHNDSNPSLAIREGEEGKILVYCHAGCSTYDVLKLAGLRMEHLMPGGPLPRLIVATHDFVDADGTLLYQELRYDPKSFQVRRPDGQDGWVWNLNGVRRVLYNLPALLKAPADETVFLVEGAGKAKLLNEQGLLATAVANGARAPWLPSYSETLRGRPVALLPDNDVAGRDGANNRAGALQGSAASVKIVELPGLGEKGDIKDWLAAGHTKAELLELVEQAEPTSSDPQVGNAKTPGTPGQVGQVSARNPMAELVAFLTAYVAFPNERIPVVIAAWVMAAWMINEWERFPHLAITSPTKRCGKTHLLLVLSKVVRRPEFLSSITPAALTRIVEAEQPTLLMDEAQSLDRPGSESAAVMRELLNAGIERDSVVKKCEQEGKSGWAPKSFRIYCGKIFAKIGEPDGVLADRCLPVPLMRNRDKSKLKRYRSRTVQVEGASLTEQITAWVEANRERWSKRYETLEPIDLENDRMAELLMPLQTVLLDDEKHTQLLVQFARELDARDREPEMQDLGILLLNACREIFTDYPSSQAAQQAGHSGGRVVWMRTDDLLFYLLRREEEPWGTFNRGNPINPERLASLLRPYGIRSARDKKQTARGYYVASFKEAWERYLPPLSSKNPSNLPNLPNPSIPSNPLLDGIDELDELDGFLEERGGLPDGGSNTPGPTLAQALGKEVASCQS
jgi:hypothetical protein